MAVVTYEGVVKNGCVRLPANVLLPEKSKVYVIVPGMETHRTTHIRSPRLVNPEQATDFIKEVLQESGDQRLSIEQYHPPAPLAMSFKDIQAMDKRAEASVVIDSSLRFALFGLECALAVEFSVKEIERVFAAASKDQISEKEYLFFAVGRLRVSGHVDEYEPETIRLLVEGSATDQQLLDSIVERAKYQAMRCQRATMTD